MNSELLHSTAAKWAKQLIDTHSRDDQRVAAAFRTALGRPATAERNLPAPLNTWLRFAKH